MMSVVSNGNDRVHWSLSALGLVLMTIALFGNAKASQPGREEILKAMKQAAVFMVDKVAVHGGYVWVVSDDLSQRWGEVPARPSQIWLQGGTERVGEVMLDAYEATGDRYYLEAARKAADALVFGQHPLGGWHYFIDFDPRGLPQWYEDVASRFPYGLEEYRHYYGNATFDDHVTSDAAQFLLRFYSVSHEAAYREPVARALHFLLISQYPNGAWPQRYPLRYEYAHDGLPDYTSFFTLNDGAAEHNIKVLLQAFDTFADERYWEAARRGVDALISLQGPVGQACWAEQYGPDMRPATARTHEPAGYVVRESRSVIDILHVMYLRTGDPRYLAPVPRCLDWFDRINRESASERYPTPRYWEPGTNRPLYVVRTGERTSEGYGKYKWVTDPSQTRCEGKPCRWGGKPIVDVKALRADHEAIAALSPKQRAERLVALDTHRRSRPDVAEVAGVIASLDARGAWVTDGISVPRPGMSIQADVQADDRVPVRGISTAVFTTHMTTLISALR
ncbi:pectate lyase [Steroidobacter agaridevorans]|uniref:pectate lyase n=1 Tax=Steroidobacter agaridevorans TaxID=2695856 RepID=UPI0013287A86|nr:pectate lyase [Steroidobacter agaridevorans]GFE87741.1 pectate lyase [Steroidobacter agaridevorans]